MLIPLLSCVTFYLSYAYGQNTEYLCSSSTREPAGRYQVTLLLNIHYGPECKRQNPRWPNSTLLQEVIRWQTYLSTGIELKIIDTCSDPDITAKVISEMVPYSWTLANPLSRGSNYSVCTASGDKPFNLEMLYASCRKCLSNKSDQAIMNLVQPSGFISETLPTGYDGVNLGLLHQVNIPFILTSDDPIRRGETILPTDITANSDLIDKIVLMAELMVEMDWDFVTVVYSDDLIGQKSMELFQNISLSYHICIDKYVAVSYTSALETFDIQTVGVVLLGSEGIGLHFLENQKPSPQIFVTGHHIDGLNMRNRVKVYSIEGVDRIATLDDILVHFSEALELTSNMSECLPAECESTSQFRQLFMEELQSRVKFNRSHTINRDGNVIPIPEGYIGDLVYNIISYHDIVTEKVAEVSLDGQLIPSEEFQPVPSLCLGDCRDQCKRFNVDKFTYIHGEWVIVVTLPIHDINNQVDTFRCEEFSESNLFRTEAAVFVFEYLTRKLNDKRFGLLLLDSCKNKLDVTSMLYNIMLGEKNVCNGQGQCFNPQSAVLIIGDNTSAKTKQLQTLVRELPMIQISYSASSIELNDQDIYTYFLRTNPSDDLQAHFMIELIKAFKSKGSDINAVNVLYSDNLYGITAASKLKEMFAKAGICINIEQKIPFPGNLSQTAHELIYSSGDVKLTLTFIDNVHIQDLMKAARRQQVAWVNAGLSFIFSESWNGESDYIQKYGDLVMGSFTFNFGINFTSNSFTSHLKKIKLPSLDDRNYWLPTLVQETGKCKIRGNFHSTYTKVCGPEGANLTKLQDELYSMHLMKAITAAIYGVRKMAFDESSESIFDPKTIQDRYETMLHISIPTILEDETTKSHHPFDHHGNGQVGYLISNIIGDNGKRGSKAKYRLLKHTSTGAQDQLKQLNGVPLFYKSEGTARSPTTTITSTIPQCEIDPSTPESHNNIDRQTLNFHIVVISMVGLLLVVSLITFLSTYFWYRKILREQKKINNEDSSNGRSTDANDNDTSLPQCYEPLEMVNSINYSQASAGGSRHVGGAGARLSNGELISRRRHLSRSEQISKRDPLSWGDRLPKREQRLSSSSQTRLDMHIDGVSNYAFDSSPRMPNCISGDRTDSNMSSVGHHMQVLKNVST